MSSGNRKKINGRLTLIFVEFFTAFLLLFDALAYYYRGNTSLTGYYMVRLCNFFVFICNFSLTFFVCFYVCEFINQSNLNFSLVLHPVKSVRNGIPYQLFIVFLLCFTGIVLTVYSQFTNLFYYFDENNLYHRSAFYPLSVVLGLLPGLISFTMLLQNKKRLSSNVFISFLVYFILLMTGVIFILIIYGLPCINISIGLGSLHLFYSSIKFMEIEFFASDRGTAALTPAFKVEVASGESRKRLVRNHLWQTLSITLGGILLVLLIISITGVSLPDKSLVIDQPYSENDFSKSVCVTFIRNADKHWIDKEDPDRTGAQYDGMIYNNMKSTIITDWEFSVSVPESSTVDPGPWNGTFRLLAGNLLVKKPHEDDAENIHGVDFYTITPLKNLGFGCIMYKPHDYHPLEERIVFTYSSILKPLTNTLFDIFLGLLFVVFIIATTIMLFEGKLIRVEEGTYGPS